MPRRGGLVTEQEKLEAVFQTFEPPQRQCAERLVALIRNEWDSPPKFWGIGKEVWFPLENDGVEVRFGRYSDHDMMLRTGPGQRRKQAIALLVKHLGLDQQELEHQRANELINLRTEQLATRSSRYAFLAAISALLEP
jgi:hypothetical protein